MTRHQRGDGPWAGLGDSLHRPEGLSRLSRRRRDVVIRWLGFAVSVAVVVAIFAVLFLARR